MLRPKALTTTLNHYVGSGVNSVILFTTEGILLSQSTIISSGEKTKAAIAANVWNIYQRHLESIETEILIDLEEGKLAISKVGNALLCLCGSQDCEFGMLHGKLSVLVQRLAEPLSRLTGTS